MESVDSLYVACLCKISETLVQVHRRISTTDNPFQFFPSAVLHDLVELVCEAADEGIYLKSSYLQSLLTSGKITHLRLTDVTMRFQDAEEIFNYIQPYSEDLKSIKIDHFFCSNCQNTPSPNFGTLLHSARNLRALKTSMNFNLAELANCINLEKLIINFKITNHLNSFLRVDNELRINNSLKVLRIGNIQDFPNLYLDIADILRYCVGIVEIDFDISQSLVHLHEIQEATQYRLRSTCLGDSMNSTRINLAAVEIAAMYCPDLRKVTASPFDYIATEALINFHHITDLTLTDPEWPDDDFNGGVRNLLRHNHFGPNLKSLTLHYFSEVDFSFIGVSCPNLENLEVKYFTEYNFLEFTENSFQNLSSLYLENANQHPCEEDTLVGILSRATSLEFLTIKNASYLNDATLVDILESDRALCKLKTLSVKNCGLSIPGLRMLVQSLESVTYICYSSSILSLEDIRKAFERMTQIRYI